MNKCSFYSPDLSIDIVQSCETLHIHTVQMEALKEKNPQKTQVCLCFAPRVFPSNLPQKRQVPHWATQRHTCHCFSDTHTHTDGETCSHWFLGPLSVPPVSGRGVEWQYGIPGGTERCGDRHPNPLSQQTPQTQKDKNEKGVEKKRKG